MLQINPTLKVLDDALCHFFKGNKNFILIGSSDLRHPGKEALPKSPINLVALYLDENASDGAFHNMNKEAVIQILSFLLKADFILQAIEPNKLFPIKNGTSEKQNLLKVKNLSITAREKEILLLIVDELTTTEIAKKLFISPTTVNSHRQNLLKKLNAKNTAGLVKAAFRLGYLDD